MTTETIFTLWGLSIVLLLVVTAVVALLLALVLRSAKNILAVASDIWTTGKLVANNTIHIPLLRETNATAGHILATAAAIVDGSQAIADHADGCPGCPACVLDAS